MRTAGCRRPCGGEQRRPRDGHHRPRTTNHPRSSLRAAAGGRPRLTRHRVELSRSLKSDAAKVSARFDVRPLPVWKDKRKEWRNSPYLPQVLRQLRLVMHFVLQHVPQP